MKQPTIFTRYFRFNGLSVAAIATFYIALPMIWLPETSRSLAQTAPSPSIEMRESQTTDEALAAARQLSQQGGEQYQAGELEAASESFQQAATLYRAADDPGGKSDALVLLSAIHGSSGQHSQAIERFQQALGITRETGDQKREANTLYAL